MTVPMIVVTVGLMGDVTVVVKLSPEFMVLPVYIQYMLKGASV